MCDRMNGSSMMVARLVQDSLGRVNLATLVSIDEVRHRLDLRIIPVPEGSGEMGSNVL